MFKSFKSFVFPSGRMVWVQGYEPFALNLLLRNGIHERYIVVGKQHVPVIRYIDEKDKQRKHFPDIYISSLDKLIEVKSQFTFEKNVERNMAKKKGAELLGYKYQIWILNQHGKLIHNIK